MKKKRLPLSLVLLASALPVASALASAPAAHTAANRVVKLQNIALHPERLVIRAGDRVTWEFLDGAIHAPHTVTSLNRAGGGRFKGVGARSTGSYSVSFHRRGTYYYQCMIHQFMQGRIVVR